MYQPDVIFPSHMIGYIFQLDQDSLPPQFLRGDIHVDDKRHLIFASDQQLELLRQARRWYVDGTFKVCF